MGKYQSLLMPGDHVNSLGIAMEVVIIAALLGAIAFAIVLAFKKYLAP